MATLEFPHFSFKIHLLAWKRDLYEISIMPKINIGEWNTALQLGNNRQ